MYYDDGQKVESKPTTLLPFPVILEWILLRSNSARNGQRVLNIIKTTEKKTLVQKAKLSHVKHFKFGEFETELVL